MKHWINVERAKFKDKIGDSANASTQQAVFPSPVKFWQKEGLNFISGI
jgi:hypothetical protein